MSWLHYLIEANIYLGVFYLCYYVLLSRDTHYMLNRVYLIASCVISFVLPVTQVSILKPVLPVIEIMEPIPLQSIQLNARPVNIAPPVHHVTFSDVVVYLYAAGAAIALFILLFRFSKLFIITRNRKLVDEHRYKLVQMSDESAAFSFFNYLFIGSNVPEPETVIAHELVHIRQKHSADIIFLEILKVINWFNPFVYFTQQSLRTIHEYIADEQTAAHKRDTLAYSSFLLNNAYGITGNSIAHSFFNYNLLKKRIIMLNKTRSGKLARLKYLAVLPLCAGMLCASTLVFSKDYGFIELAPGKPTAAKSLTDSTKYMLKLTNPKTKVSVTGSDMVYKDTLTGVEKKYTVNNLTKADQDDLYQKKGLVLEKIISKPAIDSVNYTLQLTAPDGTKGIANSVMIDNRVTGFKHTYSINTPLTEQEQKDLEANGYNLAVVERPKEWADTGKRLPPPPRPPLQKRRQPKALKGAKVPPPPPIVIEEPTLPPPPPPALPKKAKRSKVKPVEPIEIAPPTVTEPTDARVYDPAKSPVIIVNDKVYNVDKAAIGKKLNITTADSVMVYTKGDEYALKRWGDKAKNGVILLYGNPSITIK